MGYSDMANDVYSLRVAGHRKSDLSRSSFEVLARPVQEIVEEELRTDKTLSIRLQEAIDSRSLPPCYDTHPVVLKYGRAHPYALYIDAVPYSQCDSIVGFWLINLITLHRHLIIGVRKRIVCRCGCRGHCTFYPIMVFLQWGFRAIAAGELPATRHDGSPVTEDWRVAAVGTKFEPCCLLQYRGDWLEFCERLGWWTWRSALRPCWACNSFGELMYRVTGVHIDDSFWHENTDQDYIDACTACEFWVTVDGLMRNRIVGLLHYDKKDNGSRGRALSNLGVPEIGLCMGDRLEPHPGMLDVAELDTAPIPENGLRILFWRRTEESLCLHRCPLFDGEIGITPTKTVDLY